MFKKKYVLRRYEPETEAGFPYTDMTVRLNVQPVSAAELQALPEGERSVKRLKAFGREDIRTASQMEGTPADRLWYHGRWTSGTTRRWRTANPSGSRYRRTCRPSRRPNYR